MTLSSYNPETDMVSVTDRAIRHFERQLAKENASAVRISIKESGCTGYAYVLELVQSPEQSDLDLTPKPDFHVYLDEKAVPIIRGTEIDYVLEGANSVVKFNNPNARDMCGCGESFSVN